MYIGICVGGCGCVCVCVRERGGGGGGDGNYPNMVYRILTIAVLQLLS